MVLLETDLVTAAPVVQRKIIEEMGITAGIITIVLMVPVILLGILNLVIHLEEM
jgi:hypothetical protein